MYQLPDFFTRTYLDINIVNLGHDQIGWIFAYWVSVY
jgi:hypothetical protein